MYCSQHVSIQIVSVFLLHYENLKTTPIVTNAGLVTSYLLEFIVLLNKAAWTSKLCSMAIPSLAAELKIAKIVF